MRPPVSNAIDDNSGLTERAKMNINKNQAIKLTKVIYHMKIHSIPLSELMLGIRGITLQTVEDRLKQKLQPPTTK